MKATIGTKNYSPWGRIDHQVVYTTGIVFCGTASHGGMRLSKGKLTPFLKNFALEYGSSYWFEEDVHMAAVYLQYFDLIKPSRITKIQCAKNLYRYEGDVMKKYYPEFFEECKEDYEYYLEGKRYEETRKDPAYKDSFIVSATGINETLVRVSVVSGKEFLVNKEKYHNVYKRGSHAICLVTDFPEAIALK